MPFPIIGLLAAVMTAAGGYGMYWYHSMSKEEQQEADRLACEYARQLYDKCLEDLTKSQLGQVYQRVQQHFTN